MSKWGKELKNFMNDEEYLTFIVMGDPQVLNDKSKKIVGRVANEKAMFCFILGDLVEDGGDPELWDRFKELSAPLFSNFQVHAVPGNHDYQNDWTAENFILSTNSPSAYYSFKHGKCCFVFLDTVLEAAILNREQGAFGIGNTQYVWLEETLEQAKSKNMEVFVFAHHPIFMPEKIYPSTSPDIRADISAFPPNLGNLLPLLTKYRITMYFAGHIHSYEHYIYKEIHFITTGATSLEPLKTMNMKSVHRVGAAARYHYCRVRVAPSHILFSAVDEAGLVFDSFTVRHGYEESTGDAQ